MEINSNWIVNSGSSTTKPLLIPWFIYIKITLAPLAVNNTPLISGCSFTGSSSLKKLLILYNCILSL